MRTIDKQKSEGLPINHDTTAQGQVIFKDETEEFAQDGTQLTENAGLPDLYYFAVELLKLVGIEPNQEREGAPVATSDQTLAAARGSQILQALIKQFANKDLQENRFSSTDKSNFADSNVNLRTDVNTNQKNLTSHTGNINNPHNITKAQIGLGNVDNTSDINKPVSTAQQTAINARALNSDLTAHIDRTNNPHKVTKTQVELWNVPNEDWKSANIWIQPNSNTNGTIETGSRNANLDSHLNWLRQKINWILGNNGLGAKANQSDLTTHINRRNNPHQVTKTDIELGNVPNENWRTDTITIGQSVSTNRTIDTGERTSNLSGHFNWLRQKVNWILANIPSLVIGGTPSALGGEANNGSATSAARSDHVHSIYPTNDNFSQGQPGVLNNLLTPGFYSGWFSATPLANNARGTVIVCSSQFNNNPLENINFARQQIFISQESGFRMNNSRMFFRSGLFGDSQFSGFSSWVELSPPPDLTFSVDISPNQSRFIARMDVILGRSIYLSVAGHGLGNLYRVPDVIFRGVVSMRLPPNNVGQQVILNSSYGLFLQGVSRGGTLTWDLHGFGYASVATIQHFGFFSIR